MAQTSLLLLDLPEDVLVGIVRKADKRTLWRLKGTCRVLRELAELALKPLLIYEEVEVKPSLMIDSKPIILIVLCEIFPLANTT